MHGLGYRPGFVFMEFEYLGPYRVDKILGRGGMGTVYLGVHSNSGEKVAIKVIASSLADQERFRRRFAAEVETLKRIKHVNIVQLIGYGEEQGHLFYSMEYVAGHNLLETLKSSHRIPWERALEIAIEVCSALKHAHDLGIIHRDLKPANVMLTEAGQVKLTDFGIAKLFGSSDVTAAGSVLGTADYMPPEQAEGKPVTVRSDLYSLGSLLFAMICGRSPHAAKSLPEVLYNVRYAIPVSLNTLVPETPHELSELVTHLLAKEMVQRPPTALVVSHRLQSLQMGLKSRRTSTGDPQLNDVSKANQFDSIDLTLKDNGSKSREQSSKTDEQTRVVSKKPFFLDDSSIAEAENADVANAQTLAASQMNSIDREEMLDDSVGPGKTRFTVVDERERQQTRFNDSPNEEFEPTSHWISVAGLVLLLAASLVAIVYFTRSPTADHLFEKISSAVESGSDDNLISIEPLIEQFETLYPKDARVVELTSIKNEIDQQRTVKRLLRRSRVIGSESEMDPVEQAFLDCIRLQQQDLGLAKRKLNAFLTIFSRSEHLTPRQQNLVELARESLEKLESGTELKVNPATVLLNEQIEWANTHLHDEQRVAFFRALVELYADKAWAVSAMVQIQKMLRDEEK